MEDHEYIQDFDEHTLPDVFTPYVRNVFSDYEGN